MTSNENERIQRFYVGEIPLVLSVARQLGFQRLFGSAVRTHGNQNLDTSTLLLMLVCNIVCGRNPLYELEGWVGKMDARMFGQDHAAWDVGLGDDVFGRALDKLYEADRASLMTAIVLETVRAVNLDLSRIHNDSTTVKAFGAYPGRTHGGFFLARGHSKDHRPDLKQLVFSLSISADGAVPVHFKTYPGNRTDDTTHIETWNTLCSIVGHPKFLYVADCKVCTQKQLSAITGSGGRVVTIMPETWGECAKFKKQLRTGVKPKRKREIWRRLVPGTEEQFEVFSLYSGKQCAGKGQYPVYWIHSSEKQKRDRLKREHTLQCTERELALLVGKINTRNLKTERQIQTRVDRILEDRGVDEFYHIQIGTTTELHRSQKGKGRPGPKTEYVTTRKQVYTLAWARNTRALTMARRTDGIFPLLCTDSSVKPKDVLCAYKYQPNIEKKFTQFKHVHNAAPLLCKKLERVEALMLLYFVALIVQSVIERQVRLHMKTNRIESVPLYPEGRIACHPTTARVFDRFDGVSVYHRKQGRKIIRQYRDKLTSLQKQLLGMLDMTHREYWPPRAELDK